MYVYSHIVFITLTAVWLFGASFFFLSNLIVIIIFFNSWGYNIFFHISYWIFLCLFPSVGILRC